MVLWSRAQLCSGRGIQLSAKQLIVRQVRVDQADLSACANSEMALRDFVTGSDMCTPDEGAGPSNAAATLANSLLGRSAKDQERLREVNVFCTAQCCVTAHASLFSFSSLKHAYAYGRVLTTSENWVCYCSCQECKDCQDHLCMVEVMPQQWTLLLKQLLKVSSCIHST